MTYPLTFYVKSLPPNVGGCANGPVIRILDKYRHDDGIYRHELLHVKQWFVWSLLSIPVAYVLYQLALFDYLGMAVLPCALHSVLYRFVTPYRFWCEVEAYKEQAKHYNDDRRPLFAEYIASSYDLPHTTKQALDALKAK
jgi:hypothetical protein